MTTSTLSGTRISLTTPKGLTGQVRVWEAQNGDAAGAPIVFFHGTVGLFDNEPLLEALSATHSVYAPVWPSFGEEEGEEILEDMLDFALHGADVVNTLSAQLGWTQAPIVVGHDMGAMIAAEMACLNPSSMQRLVLLSPLGLWDDAHPIADMFIMLPFEWPEWLFADQALGTQLLTRGLDFEDPSAIERFQVRNARQLGMAGKILFPIPNRRLSKRLYRCTTPTTIVWGAQDKLTPPAHYAPVWAKALPQAKTVMVEGAGHMLHIEKAAEAVQAF
jgi:pimeloyl-ACP methyl ester carboxylesterase